MIFYYLCSGFFYYVNKFATALKYSTLILNSGLLFKKFSNFKFGFCCTFSLYKLSKVISSVFFGKWQITAVSLSGLTFIIENKWIFQRYFKHFILSFFTNTNHYLNFWIFRMFKFDVESPSFNLSFVKCFVNSSKINFLFSWYFFYLNFFTYFRHSIVSKANLDKLWPWSFFSPNFTLALTKIFLIFFSILSNFNVLAKFYIFICLPLANGAVIIFTM